MKVAVIIEQFESDSIDRPMGQPVVMRWDGPDHEALQRKVIARYSDILLEYFKGDDEGLQFGTQQEADGHVRMRHTQKLKEAIDRDFDFEDGGYRLTMHLADVEELE